MLKVRRPAKLADAIEPPASPPHENGKRTLPAGLSPMLGIDDLAALLSCSRRMVERMRAAGKLPPPDLMVGRCPRWRAERTVRGWIEKGGSM
jgi:hypothetical protein